MSYNPYAYTSNDVSINDRFSHETGGQFASSRERPIMQEAAPQGHFASNSRPAQQDGIPFQNPTTSMAYQLGQSAFTNFIGQQNFSQFQETVTKAAGSSSSLSHYFQVTTSYVLRKLQIIVLPFFKKASWQRIPDTQSQASGSLSFLPPKDDVNSPDLYIPIMGLVTYILVWNMQKGLQGSFNPENLYYKLSSTLAFVGLDLVILKLGLYLLVNVNSPTSSLTELVCYVGYKFVPLTLVLFSPNRPLYISMAAKVYLFIAFGVFLLRSVKFNLFMNANNDMANIKKSTVRKCNYFLFVYGFFWQSVLMWLMA
ncbi:hypothetical protein HG536_0B01110 [Torulaspora globosa]|uniref:Protein YIF1 n=1 Tax=Torulaspora globosa TaxID=48254 RepID=A0A7G3ZCL4_9SACH|nr:uncharacterized protein HG536_0B01110 [Torulaspora globosa]QLL31250.1 hypothetical protein HG536_0B01110 [Torulaspora globosa]